jgi:phenylalanyl-tRNA synthetase alpha chain
MISISAQAALRHWSASASKFGRNLLSSWTAAPPTFLSLSHFGSRSLTASTHHLSSGGSSSTAENTRFSSNSISIFGTTYPVDALTNITPRIASKLERRLHCRNGHPIYHVRRRIENYFHTTFVTRVGHPRFVIFDDIGPVVTPYQNFDSLLVPLTHPSRLPADTYHINSKHLLRSHTTAHDEELIRMGFDSFLIIGDVYRRDEIDSSHYPAFHQIDGACLFTERELFSDVKDSRGLSMFETGKRTLDKQETHTVDAAKLVEHSLKQTLLGLAHKLFGNNIEYRWVDCYFPFTHPSWELEILFNGNWLEVLGCGILEQQILNTAGATNKIGWAFGLGLDRLVMAQYAIPDIRLLWSEDPRFLDQFAFRDPETPVTFKPFSKHQPRTNDLSFWLPDTGFSSNDFYDIVRSVGGDTVLKVTLIDVFTTPNTPVRTSHCYSIVYDAPDRPISQADVAAIHQQIATAACETLGVVVR